MSRKAARFTEADVTRVLKAAKKAGLQARVNLLTGVIEVGENIATSESTSCKQSDEAARVERSKRIRL